MNKKETYRMRNEAFLAEKAGEDGIVSLGGGVLYEELAKGSGTVGVQPNSVVTAHYRGTLITGREFDNTWARQCPEAFRPGELIEGFRMALMQMHTGDRWRVYIPWDKGYGKRGVDSIPGYSTLIFEIELVGIS